MKAFVNYIDKREAENSVIPNLSVEGAKSQGLFKDGLMEAGNAIITEPSFSISAQHASPHMFKLFDLKHIGSGEWARLRGFFTLERIMCLTSLIVSVILQVV